VQVAESHSVLYCLPESACVGADCWIVHPLSVQPHCDLNTKNDAACIVAIPALWSPVRGLHAVHHQQLGSMKHGNLFNVHASHEISTTTMVP
jgi:hypothetical protein